MPAYHKNRAKKKACLSRKERQAFGAGDEARTRYLHLGKVALYQMSYTCKRQRALYKKSPILSRDFLKNFGEPFTSFWKSSIIRRKLFGKGVSRCDVTERSQQL